MSPMPPEAERTIQAAHGYHDLGMVEDAREELNSVPVEYRDHVDYLQVEAMVLLKEEHWDAALQISRLICKTDPKCSAGYIHASYSLHELGRTEEALQTLMDGPAALQDLAIYHYNKGCYLACLGDLDQAMATLRKAFQIDGRLLEQAKSDPDLKSIWSLL